MQSGSDLVDTVNLNKQCTHVDRDKVLATMKRVGHESTALGLKMSDSFSRQQRQTQTKSTDYKDEPQNDAVRMRSHSDTRFCMSLSQLCCTLTNVSGVMVDGVVVAEDTYSQFDRKRTLGSLKESSAAASYESAPSNVRARSTRRL